jgi:hypothetical protein
LKFRGIGFNKLNKDKKDLQIFIFMDFKKRDLEKYCIENDDENVITRFRKNNIALKLAKALHFL